MQSISGQASTSTNASSSSVKVAGNLAIAQIFVAEQSGPLATVRVNIDYTGGATSLRAHITICDVIDGQPGSAVLGEVTSATKDVPLSVALALSPSVELEADTSYAIVVDYPEGDASGSFVWTAASEGNLSKPCLTGSGSSWTAVDKVCDYSLGMESTTMFGSGPMTQGRAPVQPGSMSTSGGGTTAV